MAAAAVRSLPAALLSASVALSGLLPVAARAQQDGSGDDIRSFSALDTASSDKNADSAYTNIAVLTRVIQLIRQDYVDEKKTDYRALTYNALRGMLSGLDPHSQFMEPTSFKDMQEDTNSRYEGLGLTVSAKDNGTLVIVSAMEDTPAGKVGLMSGDEIRKINGVPTEKLQLAESVAALKGKPGESVTLTILRPSTKEIRDYTMIRTEIKVDSVKDSRLLDPGLSGNYKIGYVRILQFNQPTAEDLARKLDELQKQGLEALVLDLRNNPGGLLNSAVDVCGEFLPPGTVVVSTEGRTPSQSRVYRTAQAGSGGGRKRGDFPVAVLINNGSASGAEIVAGALKDLHRAILVGERTFGKGSVQSVIQLPDGSAVRLTTAKYYTPSKQVIHEHGVEPTIRATMTAEQERALYARRNGDGPAVGASPDDPQQRDNQLERALDALKGMLVYKQQLAANKK
ncbi:MAG: S41 family peptidase [Verrucomicrobia bacterium]|nr:S41 family peptidase [Verrucomicrobiota bacterium]MBV9657916.1 S41 family peptidase [Verrucomicrobiota bacterium]